LQLVRAPFHRRPRFRDVFSRFSHYSRPFVFHRSRAALRRRGPFTIANRVILESQIAQPANLAFQFPDSALTQ